MLQGFKLALASNVIKQMYVCTERFMGSLAGTRESSRESNKPRIHMIMNVSICPEEIRALLFR